ncbi:MAG: hypothetical protein AB1441_03010 [Bacillota bacterium]
MTYPRRYQTDNPHQVHQLLVSPSRYLWLKKDGSLTYRSTPFGTSRRDLEANAAKMLLRYVCRDHYTGAFYAEYVPYTAPLDLVEFVHRAWMPKGGTECPQVFCGVPTYLMVPEKIWTPELESALAQAGTVSLKPPSGFASGLPVLRHLDSFEGFHLFRDARYEPRDAHLDMVNQSLGRFMREHNTLWTMGEGRDQPTRWELIKQHFATTPPVFPPPFPSFAGRPLPQYENREQQYAEMNRNPARAHWLFQEERRLQGTAPTFRQLLRDLAEAEVWPLYEEWPDWTPPDPAAGGPRDHWAESFPFRFARAMERALDFDPDCVMALSYYGIFLFDDLKEPARAEPLLRRAVEVGRRELVWDGESHPHHLLENRPYLRALLYLADLLVQQGRAAEAQPYIAELRRLDPVDAYEWSALERRLTNPESFN